MVICCERKGNGYSTLDASIDVGVVVLLLPRVVVCVVAMKWAPRHRRSLSPVFAPFAATATPLRNVILTRWCHGISSLGSLQHKQQQQQQKLKHGRVLDPISERLFVFFLFCFLFSLVWKSEVILLLLFLLRRDDVNCKASECLLWPQWSYSFNSTLL